MKEFLIIGLIGTMLMLLTSGVVYETLAFIWDRLPKMRIGRLRIAVVMSTIFATHIISIWLYAIAYYLILHYTNLGGFAGDSIDSGHYGTDIFSVAYYSTVTYTSLGYGDIYPTGGLRFLAGIETLNGLVLVGWTVSYAFMAMLKFWRIKNEAQT